MAVLRVYVNYCMNDVYYESSVVRYFVVFGFEEF